ncbi:MAG: response regulator transcription factor [Solirubrobacteraceae bacterium]
MAKLADANSGRDRALAPVDAAVGRRDGGAALPGPVEGSLKEAVTGANGAQSARILLVEDEPGIVDFVRRGFEADGFAVESALDGVRGEQLALAGSFDAIVLDLMLPGRDGLKVLASVRAAKPEVPVIVLTARGEIEDRVAGLDAGAVDYLVKPFSLAELLARVRAQLRVVAQTSATTLRGADIEVNLLTRKVRRGDASVQLSSTEFELLVYLLRHCGQVLSREQILSAVWGYEHDPATNVVDVYIGYLRRKLARRDDPAPIYTVRAVGYRLGGAAA